MFLAKNERFRNMKGSFLIAPVAWCILVLMPGDIHAQSEYVIGGEQPPVAQPLVREGDLAVKLVDALKLGTATSEAEAESLLGYAGIMPRNGWIADYPVTPDVIGELTQSIGVAAESKSLKMGKDEALQAFQDVTAGVDLAVRGGAPGQTPQQSPGTISTPDNAVINNYYYDQGPPAVTYYPPPPDYVYLYTWVPYPFWGWDLWFPGFYILADFHRVVHVHNRVEVISNHFVDYRTNRVVRIDPLRRFNGRTFAGTGVPHDPRRFISSGVRGGNEAIFRGSRERAMTGGRKTYPRPSRGGRGGHQPSGGNRTPSGERRGH
ncbi:MAG TPA: hypothetical protein VL122_08060 [Nitrospirota bacterium]|nr:hypothetical protein [Nitrospirota bacterium]